MICQRHATGTVDAKSKTAADGNTATDQTGHTPIYICQTVDQPWLPISGFYLTNKPVLENRNVMPHNEKTFKEVTHLY